MKLNKVLPLDTIEYYYNYDFVSNNPDDIEQQFDMNPFVYETDKDGIKRLVIIWEALLFEKRTQIKILDLKVECAYILDCREVTGDALNNFRKLLEITFSVFTIYYDYLKLGHSIKLKISKDYYVGLDYHFQTLSPLLYKQ